MNCPVCRYKKEKQLAAQRKLTVLGARYIAAICILIGAATIAIAPVFWAMGQKLGVGQLTNPLTIIIGASGLLTIIFSVDAAYRAAKARGRA